MALANLTVQITLTISQHDFNCLITTLFWSQT